MDQFVVDLTDIPEVRVGDEVVVIGRQGTRLQTVADLAERAGSIPHAILAGLSTRLPRKFIRTA
jgi:alanine racemase